MMKTFQSSREEERIVGTIFLKCHKMVELTREVALKGILHWNCRQFENLPEELRQGQNVEEIYLKWNNLLCLPMWIKELQNLTNLYLQHNKLKSLPEELGELSQLNVLDVTDNHLQLLPSKIIDLSLLTHLSAAENFLSCFPCNFQKLQSLKILNLSKNNLKTLPESVGKCEALEEIYLDHNFLTSLPENIVYLQHLSILSLCENNLLHLPFQPFSSNPTLTIENNRNLNYLPMWLGDQISARNKNGDKGKNTWNLKGTNGCFTTASVTIQHQNGGLVVENEFGNTGVFLLLPSTLKKPCRGPSCCNSVPSLLELSLRMAYKLFYHHIIEKDDTTGGLSVTRRTAFSSEIFKSLPLVLLHQLNVGPTVMCYYCEQSVFSFGVIWVIHKDCYKSDSDTDIFCVLSTIVFCSISCSLLFSEREQHRAAENKIIRRKFTWSPRQ